MQIVKFGYVGCGFITGFHLRSLRQVRGVEVAGLVSRRPPREMAETARAANLGEARVYGSIREMAPSVDAVVLCCPNYCRLQAVEELVEAVRAGAAIKAVVCEKPLARNLAEARRMIELVESVQLQHIYFENQLHMRAVREAREQLRPVMEAMGAPLLTRTAEEHAGPHNAWFWDPTRQGGGVMSDMGCHCLAVGWQTLTPPDKPLDYLTPVSVSADLALMKWGRAPYIQELQNRFGVDYAATPAEDFATGMVTYRHPDGQRVKNQFTTSWMFDKQALRLSMDGLGPGYAWEVNTLRASTEIFIGDAAATTLADQELALEKSTASRGLLALQANEADLYGYTSENEDAVQAIAAGRPALADWRYGEQIVQLTMAAYLSAEEKRTVDLTDQATLQRLQDYIPAIQQGRGAEVL